MTCPSRRPLLLLSYAAVDAFPIFHTFEWDEFNARILRGEPTTVARMATVPVRVSQPSPPAKDEYATRSLFELQRGVRDPTYAG